MKMRRLMEDFEKNKKANYEKLHEEEKRDLEAARERNSSNRKKRLDPFSSRRLK